MVAASLADPERWPELGLPSSPNLSEEEEEEKALIPPRKARYRHPKITTTISTPAETTPKPTPASSSPRDEEMPNFISGKAPVQEALTTAVSVQPPQIRLGSWIDLDSASDTVDSPSEVKVNIQEPSVQVEVPVAKVVQFIPKFKGAAEMEARRRLRMAARRGPQAPPPQPTKPLTMDTSSEEEEASEGSSDEFEHVGMPENDIVDEFDP